jgi:hypothetical protein
MPNGIACKSVCGITTNNNKGVADHQEKKDTPSKPKYPLLIPLICLNIASMLNGGLMGFYIFIGIYIYVIFMAVIIYFAWKPYKSNKLKWKIASNKK